MSKNHLRAWREYLGFTQDEVAAAIGTDKTVVSKLERGDRKTSVDWLDRFGKFYNVVPSALMSAPPAEPINTRDGLRRTAYVAEVDVEASAGAGSIVDFTGEGHVWAFPEYWLRSEMNAGPSDIRIITIRGDSGVSDPPRPTDINPGDKVLVNVADRRPSPPGLFVVHDGLALIAKRIEYIARTDPARLRVSSNNPAYPVTESLLDDVLIQGRIVAKFQRV